MNNQSKNTWQPLNCAFPGAVTCCVTVGGALSLIVPDQERFTSPKNFDCNTPAFFSLTFNPWVSILSSLQHRWVIWGLKCCSKKSSSLPFPRGPWLGKKKLLCWLCVDVWGQWPLFCKLEQFLFPIPRNHLSWVSDSRSPAVGKVLSFVVSLMEPFLTKKWELGGAQYSLLPGFLLILKFAHTWERS